MTVLATVLLPVGRSVVCWLAGWKEGRVTVSHSLVPEPKDAEVTGSNGMVEIKREQGHKEKGKERKRKPDETKGKRRGKGRCLPTHRGRRKYMYSARNHKYAPGRTRLSLPDTGEDHPQQTVLAPEIKILVDAAETDERYLNRNLKSVYVVTRCIQES